MQIDIPRPLLEKATAGDPQAKETFWRIVRSAVHHYAKITCRRHSASASAVEDIVQDALITIIRRPAGALLEIRHWRGWLFRVVETRTIDYIRRRSRRDREESLNRIVGGGDEGGVEMLELIASDEPLPDDTVLRQDMLEKIQKKAATLTKENRDILRLYLQGRTHEEIAARLEMPSATVGVRIYRLKKRLLAWCVALADENGSLREQKQ